MSVWREAIALGVFIEQGALVDDRVTVPVIFERQSFLKDSDFCVVHICVLSVVLNICGICILKVRHFYALQYH
jgi:hypothetical protein